MAFIRQVRTLVSKNLRRLLCRHYIQVFIFAVLLPIALAAFFSYTKNLFVPHAVFGIGQPHPVKTLAEAFEAALPSGRRKIILVDNGHTGGDIQRVLDQLADQIRTQGPYVDIVRTDDEADLLTECRSSLRGVTECFNAVVMWSSPHEGEGGIWNYTIRTDAEFASSSLKINVGKSENIEQVYLIPIQRAIDGIIAGLDNPDAADLLASNQEQPFTSMTQKQRDSKVRELFHKTNIRFLAIGFMAVVLWVSYHLTGFIAEERESGMSQLLDAMMPVSRPWMSLAARIISHHLSFTLVYAPGWIAGSVIVHVGVFPRTSLALIMAFNVIAGLAFTSMTIFLASFFRKSQLSAGATIIMLVLGIVVQMMTSPGTTFVKVSSALFSPCAFVFFVKLMSQFERSHIGANLSEIPIKSSWRLPGGVLWSFLIVQIFVYPLLAALVEKQLFGASSVGRKVLGKGDNVGPYAVKLEQFTKIYPPKLAARLRALWSEPNDGITAVNGLSFNIRRGEIVALLGANGSGKSTTLDSIAGMSKLTSGSITVDGTGGLGIAPQKNVLWDDLTVEEHVRIFDRLKSPDAPATDEQIADLIGAIDLELKRKALAKTLSGGQKRKLQLGMMLAGGSSVCCVDEVSSGIDPLFRRKLWDILLAERGRRTLIITTHFLDEADLLADHIAILSKGTLRAEGSSVELKDRIGGGYRVQVPKPSDARSLPKVPEVKKKAAFGTMTYIAPTSDLAAQVIRELQTAGITDYCFSGPTLEHVFLKLAEEIREEEQAGSALASEKRAVPEHGSFSQDSTLQSGLQLLDGRRTTCFEQAGALLWKRWAVFKRGFTLHLVAFLLPIMAAALTSFFVRGEVFQGCRPEDQASSIEVADAFSQIIDSGDVVFLAGPSYRYSHSLVLRLFGPIFAGDSGPVAAVATTALANVKIVDTFDGFQQYIRDHPTNVTAALWLGDESSKPTIGWVANVFLTSSLTANQFLDVLLTNTTIATSWSPFDTPFNAAIGKAFSLVVYMGLALMCCPAFFALYPSRERRTLVRSFQYSNGVRPLPLWIAYMAFDFAFVFVGAGLTVGLWMALSKVWFHIEYVFVVLFLYGAASTLLGYIMSLFAPSQIATFTWTTAFQGVLFAFYLLAHICVVTYVEADKIDSTILLCHFLFSVFIPIGSVARALFVATNLLATACDGTAVSTNPAAMDKYGGPILYLLVQCAALLGLLLWLDTRDVVSSLRKLFSRRGKPEQSIEQAGEDLVKETNRVAAAEGPGDGLRVVHLTKAFGKNTAVDNVTFGVKRGEVFALLGPNGAGKSTTMSLIRGDLKPSHNGGDALVGDASVTKSLATARASMGICPQFDALDRMTVREHLVYYANIRGIANVEHNVTAILQGVGLTAFSTRMAPSLSGGNKRKLSLGIALMGNPSVVLLDEPSSGLDAASKRVMWKTLQGAAPGRSILLTTHSMEEADALAGRAGFLARRMLALGTPDELRHRFGDVLHVHLVSGAAPRTTDEDMARIVGWIGEALPAATVESKTYHGQLRFSVRAADVPATAPASCPDEGSDGSSSAGQEDIGRGAIGRLVLLLEEHKERLGVKHYSVSPTTLDQVFLSIVGNHGLKEEDNEDKPNWLKRLVRSVASSWRRVVASS